MTTVCGTLRSRFDAATNSAQKGSERARGRPRKRRPFRNGGCYGVLITAVYQLSENSIFDHLGHTPARPVHLGRHLLRFGCLRQQQAGRHLGATSVTSATRAYREPSSSSGRGRAFAPRRSIRRRQRSVRASALRSLNRQSCPWSRGGCWRLRCSSSCPTHRSIDVSPPSSQFLGRNRPAVSAERRGSACPQECQSPAFHRSSSTKTRSRVSCSPGMLL